MPDYDFYKVDKNTVLYRVKALKSFGDVNKGDLGGFIEKESNLSHDGNCWVYNDAKVFENAMVFGIANIQNFAGVNADAKVYGAAIISDYAFVSDDAEVFDNARVRNGAVIVDHATVRGDSVVKDDVIIEDCVNICGDVQLIVNFAF